MPTSTAAGPFRGLLIASLRKTRLRAQQRQLDVQALTNVNTMLFEILVTPRALR
ncbi:MAG: hypothetical protein ACRDQ5_28515 [Sciscionella sp.]